MKFITNEVISTFGEYLVNEEKAPATVSKYLHDVNKFFIWLKGGELNKSTMLEYKALLCEKYAPVSVNAALASLNSFFAFIERYDLKVKNIKIQKQIFVSEEKELTRREYDRLLVVAKQKNNERLYFLMQTICSTGIRVSELKYITIDAITEAERR